MNGGFFSGFQPPNRSEKIKGSKKGEGRLQKKSPVYLYPMDAPEQLHRKRLQKNVDFIQVDTSKLNLIHRKAVNVLFHNYIKKCEELHVDHFDDFISIPIAILKVLVNYSKKDNFKFYEELLKMQELSVKYVFKDNDKTRIRSLILFHTIDYIPETNTILYNVNKNISGMIYDPKIYTKLYLGLSRIFKSKHSLSLWENCKVHLFNGETPAYPIETWKKLLGVSAKYESFKVFNQKVIKKSVEEINLISDINITARYFRGDKKHIESISFIVKRNATKNQEWIKQYPIEVQGYLIEDQTNEMNSYWLKKFRKSKIKIAENNSDEK